MGLAGVSAHSAHALQDFVKNLSIPVLYPTRRRPEALVWKLLVEHGVVDRPEMAFRANLGVNLPASVGPRVIDLPSGIVGKHLLWPWRRFQPGKSWRCLIKWIRPP